jgi:hypothetical protein
MQAVPPVPLDDDDNEYFDYSRMDDDTTQRQIFANFAKLKRQTSPDGSDAERVRLAHETARLIQLEVQRWEASVAELEASVSHQQLPGNRNNVVFPTMPAVVMDVMDDHGHPRSSAAPPLAAATLPPPPPPNALLAVADWNDSEEDDEMEEDSEESSIF